MYMTSSSSHSSQGIMSTQPVNFFYTDSGPPPDAEYTTIFFIHGHTFHSSIFQRLATPARSRGLRLICFNRRGYPWSTPYSSEEQNTIAEGSEAERAAFLHQQGLDIALFIDGLIQELLLPQKVAIAGWSMGNAFLIACLASIHEMPGTMRGRLRTCVKHFFLLGRSLYRSISFSSPAVPTLITTILKDPPSQLLGIPSPPNTYHPLQDKDIPPEARGAAFTKWCSSYFRHGPSREFSNLAQRDIDPSKLPTVESMTPEELQAVTAASGATYDSSLSAEFGGVLAAQTEKALFDPGVREAWGAPSISLVYGEASPWNCVFAAWSLEERMGGIRVEALEGANHFFVWEEPERTVAVLVECLKF
ncbi:hypothetical protein D9615_007154 [Tricholomella constricta]|uniref:AB hydrolase-1 domain-containing protein n=1 Tax=Tricholomella constricta TaxID=117010 RepID=A0A8H5M2M8_9AGAR|nr:hypothetical protein D9615_007154 [Tricholomella constricta]